MNNFKVTLKIKVAHWDYKTNTEKDNSLYNLLDPTYVWVWIPFELECCIPSGLNNREVEI